MVYYITIINQLKKSMEVEEMRKYVDFEKMTIAKYNRGLINFEQAESYLYGYLKCLVDMQELDRERLGEEFTISVNKLLKSIVN